MDRVTEFLEAEFPDTEERALLLGIATTPTDKTAKLVYADWLDERDDSRGEYVRLLVKNEGKKPTARVKQLRKKCSGPWLLMMGELHEAFAQMQAIVVARGPSGESYDPEQFLPTFDCGLWDIRYIGNLQEDWQEGTSYDLPPDAGLPPVLRFLMQPEIAPVLRSFVLDDGDGFSSRPNGTLGIKLFPPLNKNVGWNWLESFVFKLPADACTGIILDGPSDAPRAYHEGGQVAKLLATSPRLRSLAVPSAPTVAFFEGDLHPLEVLDVRSGYDTEQFIPNLAKTKRFPNLRVLRYTDYCGCWERDREKPHHSTTVEHFAELLRSPAMRKVETIELREVLLTPGQVRSLRRIRSQGVKISRSQYAWKE
jgi:uncharacterized protein (TIGR02996 family)